MSQYASTIAAMEADLQSLDIRRAQLIAAIGAVRVLEGGHTPAPVVQPAKTAEKGTNERTNERSKPRANRTAVRSLPDDAQNRIIAALRAHGGPMTPKALSDALRVNRLKVPALVAPLVERHLVSVTGLRRGKRITLLPGTSAALDAPRADAPRPSVEPRTSRSKGVSHNDGQLETVWDGRKGSPSLTGEAGGLGSTLSGITHAVVRSR